MKRRMQASVLQSTLQHSTTAEQLGYSSLRACIEGVWRREGLRSFYRVSLSISVHLVVLVSILYGISQIFYTVQGMVPTILKAAVSSGVGFLSFEVCVEVRTITVLVESL